MRGRPGERGISAARLAFGILAHRLRPSSTPIAVRSALETPFQRSFASAEPAFRRSRLFFLGIYFRFLKIGGVGR
jgi:hypothetical protein